MARTRPLSLLLAIAASPACLMPPARVVQAVQAAKSAPRAEAEKNAGDIVAPSKPTGLLISDGTQPTVMNLHPGGGWFIFHDPTPGGTMYPPTTDLFTTGKAMEGGVIHSSGSGFLEWGGGIGANFQGAEALTPIDASDFKGISFKAWGKSALHFGLATKATMPEFNQCQKCFDHFAVDIYLTDRPTVYTLTWDDLRPAGWGTPKPVFDAHAIVGVNFTSKGAVPWDFTIDDLKFIQ